MTQINKEVELEVEGDINPNDEDSGFIEYDIISSPNDFNTNTIFNLIESGVVKIPGFQRNYVWDIKRASKLIESLIIGLPIPQVFFYEEERNSFLVIDGQQRLLTIYYFLKKKFPKKEKRSELRQIFDKHGSIPEEILNNKDYFDDFELDLPSSISDKKNKFNGLNYSTLKEHKTVFELRTIRVIIVKQVIPQEEDSTSKYEIFNRLNSGGINLTPQEIRTSLYHCPFYEMLYRINMDQNWRKIIGKSEPDLHMKDIEIMLRGFGMLIKGANYSAPMTKFLNIFSSESKHFDNNTILYLEKLFLEFSRVASSLDHSAFLSKGRKFNISIFESIFCAMCKDAYENQTLEVKNTTLEKINQLKDDTEFINATQEGVAGKRKVETRLRLATELL